MSTNSLKTSYKHFYSICRPLFSNRFPKAMVYRCFKMYNNNTNYILIPFCIKDSKTRRALIIQYLLTFLYPACIFFFFYLNWVLTNLWIIINNSAVSNFLRKSISIFLHCSFSSKKGRFHSPPLIIYASRLSVSSKHFETLVGIYII